MSEQSKTLAKEDLRQNFSKIILVALVYGAFFVVMSALSFSTRYIVDPKVRIIIKYIFMYAAEILITYPVVYGWSNALYYKKYQVKEVFTFFKRSYFIRIALISLLIVILPKICGDIVKSLTSNKTILVLLIIIDLFITMYCEVVKFVYIRNPNAGIIHTIFYAFTIFISNLGELIYFMLSFIGWFLIIFFLMTFYMALHGSGVIVLVLGVFLLLYVLLYYSISSANFYKLLIDKFEGKDDE